MWLLKLCESSFSPTKSNVVIHKHRQTLIFINTEIKFTNWFKTASHFDGVLYMGRYA